MSTDVKVEVEEIKPVSFADVELVQETEDNVTTITVDKKLYVEKAKEAGIDEETLSKVATFDKDYLSSSYAKIVDAAEGIYKANKENKSIHAKLPFGLDKKDTIQYDIDMTRKISLVVGSKKPEDIVRRPKINMTTTSSRFGIHKKVIKDAEKRLQALIAG